MSQTISRVDYEHFSRHARELRRQVEALTASMAGTLGECHPVTLKTEEIDGCIQRLQWILERSLAGQNGKLRVAATD